MITTGHSNYCAITTHEELYCWGEENTLALDHPKNSRFVDISQGEEIFYGCSLDEVGQVTCWGDDTYEVISNMPVGGSFKYLSVGDTTVCTLNENGIAYCWGDDSYGLTTAATGNVCFHRCW